MATAPVRKKTYSEIYTATQEAERLLGEADSGLDAALRRIHDNLADPRTSYIKKVMGKVDDENDPVSYTHLTLPTN